jgi:hypothetical protein
LKKYFLTIFLDKTLIKNVLEKKSKKIEKNQMNEYTMKKKCIFAG